jgi:hypothetical protein
MLPCFIVIKIKGGSNNELTNKGYECRKLGSITVRGGEGG